MAKFNINVTFNFTVDHSDVVDFEGNSQIIQNISISAEKLANCQSEYSYAVGFDLTVKQMLEVIFSNPDSMQDFIVVTDPELSTSCLAPSLRWDREWLSKDRFCNAFGKYVLQDDRHWPIGRHSPEYTTKYFDDLNEKGIALGYVGYLSISPKPH